MPEIKSKFSLQQFLSFAISIIVMLGLTFMFLIGNMKKSTLDRELGPLLLVGFLLIWNFVLIEYVRKNVAKIIISDKGILFAHLFKKTFIPWEKISNIKLSGKSHLTFAFYTKNYEAAFVVTPDKVYDIPIDFYSNYSELLTLLNEYKNKINQLKTSEIPLEIIKKKNNIKKKQKYSGLVLTTMDGIKNVFLIVALSFASLMEFGRSGNPGLLIIALLFLSILYFFSKSRFNFFVISEESIIIRHALYFWRKSEYAFYDIKELVIEKNDSNSPIGLRIILKNFSQKSFYAAALSKKTWQKFADHSKENVNIRVEESIY